MIKNSDVSEFPWVQIAFYGDGIFRLLQPELDHSPRELRAVVLTIGLAVNCTDQMQVVQNIIVILEDHGLPCLNCRNVRVEKAVPFGNLERG